MGNFTFINLNKNFFKGWQAEHVWPSGTGMYLCWEWQKKKQAGKKLQSILNVLPSSEFIQ